MVRLARASVARRMSGGVVLAVVAGSVLLPVGVANAAPLATTTTTLAVLAPAGPLGVAPGTVETLTATVSPAATGSVQFKDGSADIGTPVIVSAESASTTTTLPPGTHLLTAVFSSTDPAFTGSSSPAVRAVVSIPTGVMATTTTLRVLLRRALPSIPVVLLANVAPRGAAGTIQFFDGATALGAPVPATSGFALRIMTLPNGAGLLAAVFTPTNPAIFVPSTSPPI